MEHLQPYSPLKPRHKTIVHAEDGPRASDRIDPIEIFRIVEMVSGIPLDQMAENGKAAICIYAGVPVDYIGNGRWQLRYPCAIIESETELKVRVVE